MTGSVMDCAEIRNTLLGGSVPTGPAVEAHVRDCAPCSELLSGQAALGRELARFDPTQDKQDERRWGRGPTDPDSALWTSLDSGISAETGPRAWLRSRKTWLRVLLATACGAVIVAVGGQPAPDFVPATQAVTWLVLFSLAALVCLWVLAAPLGRPRLRGKRAVLAWAALALPLGYALGSANASSPQAMAGELGFTEQAIGCFVYGSVLALPFLVVVWTLDRIDRPRGMLLTSMAAAAGLVANAALARHCPNTAPLHLAIGHATIGVALAGIGAFWMFARSKSP
jgi:hypothetical protein